MKRLEVLKNELYKMAIKLNPGVKLYEIGHTCDHARKYSKELLINGFSFLTYSTGGGAY